MEIGKHSGYWACIDEAADRIRELEAQNAALLADVNQDEGYERLKSRCAQLEVALCEIAHGGVNCPQCPEYAEAALNGFKADTEAMTAFDGEANG